MMGGKIGVKSKLGHGSTFYFTVPYIPAEDPGHDSREANTRAVRSRSPSGKLSGKILLVDDSEVNLKLAERVIVKMGCSSITAKNGRLAVTIFERDPSVNLILMDKEMPELDGLSATKAIREIEASENPKAIPIIALTAAAMNGDREECIAVGCTEYLPKPLDREKLHRLLMSFL